MSDFWDDDENYDTRNTNDDGWDDDNDYGHSNRRHDDLQLKEISVVSQKKSKKNKKRQQQREESDDEENVEDEVNVQQQQQSKKKVSSRYEETDEEGFTKLKKSKDVDQQVDSKKKQQQQATTTTVEKVSKSKKTDNKKIIQNLIEDIEDPLDYLARQNIKASQKTSSKQRSEHKKAVKHTQPAKEPAVKSKAEKQGKLSNITKLEFNAPKNQKKEVKKPKSDESQRTKEPTATLESVASALNVKDFYQLIKKSETTYPNDQYYQLQDIAGWFELQFLQVTQKDDITAAELELLPSDLNKAVQKWLKTMNHNPLLEVFKFGLTTIYTEKGTPKQAGKYVGLRLFLQEIITAKPKAAAEALSSSTTQFPQHGASLKAFRSILSQILARNILQGTKTAIYVILSQLYGTGSKLKANEQQELVNYLNTLLQSGKFKEAIETESTGIITLVDPSQFISLQKQIFTTTPTPSLETLYENIIPVSVFFSPAAPALFFESELALLKNPKVNEKLRKDVSAILLKSLKQGGEKCVDVWVRSISKHVQATSQLLEYINEQGGLQGVKGVDQVTRELNRVAESDKVDEAMVKHLKEQTETLKRKNAEGSILGFLVKLLFLIVLLLGVTYVATTVVCKDNNQSKFCQQTQWIVKLLEDMQKRNL